MLESARTSWAAETIAESIRFFSGLNWGITPQKNDRCDLVRI